MATDEEKLILDNMNLAYSIAWKYYKTLNNKFEFEDLKSICLLGLVKAGKSFKEELKNTFSTYAYIVIVNEILQVLHHTKNSITTISIYENISNNLSIIDTLEDNFDLYENISSKDDIVRLYKEINKLPEYYKKLITYRLQGLTVVEIGKIVGKSLPQISRDLTKIMNSLRNKFEIDKEVN